MRERTAAFGVEHPVAMNPRLFLRPPGEVVGAVDVLALPAGFSVFVRVVGAENRRGEPCGWVEAGELFGAGAVLVLGVGVGGAPALQTVDEGLWREDGGAHFIGRVDGGMVLWQGWRAGNHRLDAVSPSRQSR